MKLLRPSLSTFTPIIGGKQGFEVHGELQSVLETCIEPDRGGIARSLLCPPAVGPCSTPSSSPESGLA